MMTDAVRRSAGVRSGDERAAAPECGRSGATSGPPNPDEVGTRMLGSRMLAAARTAAAMHACAMPVERGDATGTER